MRKLLTAAALMLLNFHSYSQEFNKMPSAWKWLSSTEAAFTFDGSYTDSTGFIANAKTKQILPGVNAPEKASESPVQLAGAVNPTYSPDSTKIAFTREGDLFVTDLASGEEKQLTFDGTSLILNGYASWVYYEEILGRPSKYRAFWWSPDSRKLAYYRFDDTEVPMFPIYSPFGQDGTLVETHYPKAGEKNPSVQIGFLDIETVFQGAEPQTVWADFNPEEDQYFGKPFWSPDSRTLFVQREPRLQNTLDLYAVHPEDGSKHRIYHEEYKTWVDFMDDLFFTDKGLYMVRSFETLWEQIYFLSYDGKECKRLTSGENWRIRLHRVDGNGSVYFSAQRDSHVSAALYKADSRGAVTALTDPALHLSQVSFSPDGRYFIAALSNYTTPTQIWICQTSRPIVKMKVADLKGPAYEESKYALPQLRRIISGNGMELPAAFVMPRDFDPVKHYPVHVDLYGGPDTPLVTDRWTTPNEANQWWSEHGIIEVVADCRAAGHNGRAGLDQIYRHLGEVETEDFVAWADYLKSLPYVDPDKIGVEGFSYGGTMTARLVMEHPEAFHYGIAGGGVYDWTLYDSHYTERFMSTPQDNPEGYAATRVVSKASFYPAAYGTEDSVMLKLTHGTADDNVHFQNTLQLVNELILQGKKFELMIYPDGKHGYRGEQRKHSSAADRDFWLKYLK